MSFMEITHQNIDNYVTGSYPDTTEIIWKTSASSLTKSILGNFPNLHTLTIRAGELCDLDALEGCPQVQKLDCKGNYVPSLKPLSFCPDLRVLDCTGSVDSLEGIESCPLLEKLVCGMDTDDHAFTSICPTDLELPRDLPQLRTLTVIGHPCTDLEWLQSYPQLTKLTIKQHQITSLHGLRFCPELKYFCCAYGLLPSLEGIQSCPKLEVLYCYSNIIYSLEPAFSCPLLREIACINNRIRSLIGIRLCSNLRKLWCGRNEIQSLEGIEGCEQLELLDCRRNWLLSLCLVSNCKQLRTLVCCNNLISFLDPISTCTALTDLDCSANRLKSLDGIERCLELRSLICHTTNITHFDPLVYLPHLESITHDPVALGSQTAQVHRYLDRVAQTMAARAFSDGSTIYADNQNIHNFHIQQTLCESVQRLLTDPKPIFSIDSVIASGMSESAIRLLVEYCDDETVHSRHLLTYIELLSYVWARIERSEHRTELIKILGDQILDSHCKCFTGRFNRTLSVLTGFYDDIVIEVSDSSRIGAIILSIKDRVVPYDPAVHREQSRLALTEAGYSKEEMQSWLDAISEH